MCHNLPKRNLNDYWTKKIISEVANLSQSAKEEFKQEMCITLELMKVALSQSAKEEFKRHGHDGRRIK